MTIDETRKLLDLIQDFYPNTRFSPDSDRSWHGLLEQFPRDAVLAVTNKLMLASPQFAPNAPAIVAELMAITNPGLSAQDAWEKVLKAGVRCAANDPVCVSEYVGDSRIADAVRAIGWYRIATADYQDHGTLYAQFRDAYAVVAERHERTALREATPALTEMSDVSAIEAGRDPWPGPLPMLQPVANGWQKAGE